MPFEYAASYPREAEQSLDAAKSAFTRALGLFNYDLIRENLSIVAVAEGEGYHYSIKATNVLREKIQQKIDALPIADRNKFDSIQDLCQDDESDQIELDIYWDGNNLEFIGAQRTRTATYLAAMQMTDTIKKYSRYLAALEYCDPIEIN